MSRRPIAQRDRDRSDLLAIVQEADGPVSLHRLAADTHDPADHWERHLNRVYTDLRAMRTQGKLVSDGAPWAADRMRWALADSTMADEVSDRAEVGRMLAGWEQVPGLPEVPC